MLWKLPAEWSSPRGLEPEGDPVVLFDGELRLPVPDGEPGTENFNNVLYFSSDLKCE